jgi:Rho-binding antiterminator
MSHNTPYTPIDCSMYDVLEALATLRRPAEIVYRDDDDAMVTTRDVIADVYSRENAEYVRLAIVRLDRLVTVDGEPVRPAC